MADQEQSGGASEPQGTTVDGDAVSSAQSVLDALGPTATALGIVASLASLVSLVGGVFLYNLRRENEENKKALQSERSRTRQLSEQRDEVLRAAAASGSKFEVLAGRRVEAVALLNDIIDHSGADLATLYVPVHCHESRFLGLMVLATAPSDRSNEAFLGTVFAGRDSAAVRSYLSRTPVYTPSTKFSIDEVVPRGAMAECIQESGLKGDGQVRGVVQVLSVSRELDQARASAALRDHKDALIPICRDFTGENERNIEASGLSVPRQATRGTVLTFDVSRSSLLFTDEARSSVTRALMDELMKASAEKIVKQDGTFESFTGDGFLAACHGGARDRERNPARRALDCLEDLIASAEDIFRRYRTDLAETRVNLSVRVGLATGVIHPISLAYGQLRSASVVGRTPSLSRKMCDLGGRESASLVIDGATLFELDDARRREFHDRELDHPDVSHVSAFPHRVHDGR